MNAPLRFTTRVPNGKLPAIRALTAPSSRKRPIAPSPPSAPTASRTPSAHAVRRVRRTRLVATNTPANPAMTLMIA